MIPVYQTKFGDRGNCFSACVASLLHVQCDDIPNLADYPNGKWFDPFNDFLIQTHNCCLVLIQAPIDKQVFIPEEIPFIVSCDTVKGSRHAVIMAYIRNQAELLHDPNPSGEPLEVEFKFIAFLARS